MSAIACGVTAMASGNGRGPETRHVRLLQTAKVEQFQQLSRDMILAAIRHISDKKPSPAQAKMKKNELAACTAKLVQGTG